jgi:hypothetical protein
MTPRRHVVGPDPLWTYSYGARPYTVNAYERPERGHQVWIRWTNAQKSGREKRDKQPLGLRVRNLRLGKLDAQLVKAAERAVQQFQATLLTGVQQTAQPLATAESLTVEAPSLTLREGFDVALQPTEGKYPATGTRRYDQMLKYRERLFGAAAGAPPLIDPSLPWTALEAKHTRAMWRTMAARYLETERQEFGPRAAEGIIDALYSVASWLREEGHIPPNAAQPAQHWRTRLKEEWAQRTGERRTRPNRPRHSEEEYRRIFAALSDPRVDPRIRLAIELAAECRTGQVLRCTRTMLTLTDVGLTEYESAPPGALGQIEIPGAGKKHGEVVVFTLEQRRAVDDALGSYLANYEAAWLAGELKDYYLFPGSRMRMLDEAGRRWTRRVRPDAKPLSRDGARAAFQELERIARVPYVRGRGWYGLRRIAADMAETETTDDRVKDRLGGWKDSETRKQIYQDRETDRLRVEAASVRRRMRLGADPRRSGEASASPKPRAVVDVEAVLASLTGEQRALLAARLNVPEMGSAAPTAAPNANAPGAASAPARLTAEFAKPFRERATGLEPATSSLGSWHSTN